MPYPTAHPLAVIPLARALGRFAVPSALAIGSVIPDAQYLVPGLGRAFSHNPSGLVLFCLPAGLLAYLLFHVLVKEPLLQLLPRELAARARAFACRGLPHAPWSSVVISLLAGAATHLVWDGFTHDGPRMTHLLPVLFEPAFHVGSYAVLWVQLTQHGSTLVGSAALLWWLAAKLRQAAPVHGPVLAPAYRATALAFLVASVALCAVLAWPGELELRQALRAAASAGAAGLGVALLVYSVVLGSVHATKQR